MNCDEEAEGSAGIADAVAPVVKMALVFWVISLIPLIIHIYQVGSFMEASRMFWAPFYEESYFPSVSDLQIVHGVILTFSSIIFLIAYVSFVYILYTSSLEYTQAQAAEQSPPFFNSFRIRMMSNALLIGAILVILFKGISGITIDQFLYIGLPVLLASVALDAWALRKNSEEVVLDAWALRKNSEKKGEKKKSSLYRLYLWCPTSICLILMVALCSIAMPFVACVYGVYRVYLKIVEESETSGESKQDVSTAHVQNGQGNASKLETNLNHDASQDLKNSKHSGQNAFLDNKGQFQSNESQNLQNPPNGNQPQ